VAATVSPETVAATVPEKTVAATVSGLRPRVDAGRMVLDLGKPEEAGGKDDASLGWAAYQRGDVETASAYLAKAAAGDQAPAWVHYALGLSHFALQHYPDAGGAWERVRAAAPEFEPVYFNLADAYMLQHKESNAIAVLREAERRWPNDPEIYNAVGVLQIRRNAVDAAIESFLRAIKAAPGDALAYFNVARAYQMRWARAQRYDKTMERWIGGDDDRKKAAENYQKYIELGGPYVQQARDALEALNWRS
jgi:tetratricopeptide (TPR) repeat protein